LLWNQQTGPEIANFLNKTGSQFEELVDELSVAPEGTAESHKSLAVDPIILAAKSLGIATEGKSKATLAREIAERNLKQPIC